MSTTRPSSTAARPRTEHGPEHGTGQVSPGASAVGHGAEYEAASTAGGSAADAARQKAATVHQALLELREEVIKTRNMAIRVDNTVQNLATTVKDVERRQVEYRSRSLIGSIGTYILFVIIIGAFAIFASEKRLEGIATERDIHLQRVRDVEKLEKDREAEAAAHKEAERLTAEALKLVESERVDEGFTLWREKVDEKLLPDLLARLARQRMRQAADQAAANALERGNQLVKMGSLDQALSMFLKSIEFAPQTATAEQAYIAAAETMVKKRQFEEGAKKYLELVEQMPTSKFGDDAMIAAAEAYERAQLYSKAADVYDRLVEKFPRSGFVPQAQQLSARNRWRQKRVDAAKSEGDASGESNGQ